MSIPKQIHFFLIRIKPDMDLDLKLKSKVFKKYFRFRIQMDPEKALFGLLKILDIVIH